MKIDEIKKNIPVIYIVIIATLLYIPFLGGVHLFDWDEINFAEISREMLISKNYLQPQINFISFTEKPPLFFWFQSISMKIFGINEFAARFPNAICGIIVLVSVFLMGKKIKDTTFGWLWAGSYFGSILPSLYFKSGIIDPWFNFFIFMGIFHLILLQFKINKIEKINLPKNQWYYVIMAAFFTGLGVLTKGPVALLITGLAMGVYFILHRFIWFIKISHIIVYILFVIIFSGIWFTVEWFNDPNFIIEFTIRQWELFSTPDAGHSGFIGYHFVVLLIGCFPISIFLMRSHGKLLLKDKIDYYMKFWMMILFWVVLILFSIVKSKIVHYSSMVYYPISFLSAMFLYQWIQRKVHFVKWMKISFVVIVFVLSFILIMLPFVGMNIDIIKPLFSKDLFALKNLDASVDWHFTDTIPGFWFLTTSILFLVYQQKDKIQTAIKILFIGMGTFVFVALIFLINNIELYSQRAAIDFYKSKANSGSIVEPIGYKSYAHFFYTKRMPNDISDTLLKSDYVEYLLKNSIDKEVYFVSKITTDYRLRNNENIKFIYEKNGFSFWKKQR